jgi:DNA-binding response OmpR family regulator
MRLLLVEDTQDIVKFLKPALEAELFVVDVANDGERGSYLACTNEYDIIVLDNYLPKKTGFDICKELRTKGSNVPIIMLSVRTEAMIKASLLNAGANDYLSKPFSFQELLARIRVQLRPSRGSDGHILVVGDLIFDIKQRRAKRGDKELLLNNKECMLLEFMMRNCGSVLSRSMLLEHVWGMSTDPLSRTVDSHILSLRKKIEIPGTNKLIYTQVGTGYWIAQPE